MHATDTCCPSVCVWGGGGRYDPGGLVVVVVGWEGRCWLTGSLALSHKPSTCVWCTHELHPACTSCVCRGRGEGGRVVVVVLVVGRPRHWRTGSRALRYKPSTGGGGGCVSRYSVVAGGACVTGCISFEVGPALRWTATK
jgi:hypothetical protein